MATSRSRSALPLPSPRPRPRQAQPVGSSRDALRQMVREYDEAPFDPEAPVARPGKHVYLNNGRRQYSEGRGGLDNGTLTQLLEMEMETFDVPSRTARDIATIDKTIIKAADAYHSRIWNALDSWQQEHQSAFDWKSPELVDEDGDRQSAVNVMDNMLAAYLYFMEAEGHGVGTWDGDWDTLFKNPDKSIKQLSEYVAKNTHKEYQALKNALDERAWSLMEEHGLPTMESNPRKKATKRSR